MKRKIITSGILIAMSALVISCSESLTDSNLQPTQKIANGDLSQASNLSKTIVPDDAYIVVYKDQTSDRELES